jgi:hypothetical protein
VLAVGAHDQHAPDRLLVEQLVEEAEGGAAGPLHVVEEQHDRSVRRGHRAQDPHPAELAAQLRGQRIPRVRSHAEQRPVLGGHRGHEAGVLTERRPDPFPHAGELVFRLGQQQPAERPEALVHRAVLHVASVLVGLAGHEPAASTRHHRTQLVDQRGLAHPRRAGDQHCPAPPGPRILERLLQRGHLGIPADQPGRREQPQPDVVLAHAYGGVRRGPQLLEVVQQALGRLVTAVGLLLQQVHDDLGQRRWHRGVHRGRGRRHPRHVVVGQPQWVAGAERRRPGRQLVQRRAQRVQVGALVDGPAGAAGLLRGQVRQRAHDLGVMGELRADLGQRRGQPEADQARGAVRRDHDVGRGDVPVQDAPAVHPRDRLRHRRPEPDEEVGLDGGGQTGQVGAARVGQRDRPRVARFVQELRDAGNPPYPLQHRQFVPQPARRVRSQQLLADHGAPGEKQPGDPRTAGLLQHLGHTGLMPAWQALACLHRRLPRAAGRGSRRAYARPARSRKCCVSVDRQSG